MIKHDMQGGSKRRIRVLAVFITLAMIPLSRSWSGDWPAYRHDNHRSAITPEQLPGELVNAWSFTAQYAPEPAWSDPKKEKPRVQFDEVFHVAAAGDALYFGSSADGKVYCLDADSGALRWSASTNGPIRVAPAIAGDRVYAGSDDGCAYCFGAGDGHLIWQAHAAWRDERIIGNQRMISRWPVRTGVLVEGGTAYFGAGVFPHETLFLCAANAETGALLWRNDTYGEEGYKLEFGGISPQGPLLASESRLFVPSGRAMPAVFDRSNGDFITYLSPGGHIGGTWSLLAEDRLVAGADGKRAYDLDNGKMRPEAVYAWFPGLNLVVGPDTAYMSTFDELIALDRSAFAAGEQARAAIDRERKKLNDRLGSLKKKVKEASGAALEEMKTEIRGIEQRLRQLDTEQKQLENAVRRWSQPCKHQHALILAGQTLYLGGAGSVKAVNTETGLDLWDAPVNGRACGLAVANGRLFVSTSAGQVYAFAAHGTANEIVQSAGNEPAWKAGEDIPEAAADILRRTGVNKGYCLVYGNGTGRLAYELARNSDLTIIGFEPDPQSADAARDLLETAGLYGKRITIDQGDPAQLPYADYFADLVVSETMMATGQPFGTPEEMRRVTKPCGGVICLPLDESQRAWLPAKEEFSSREDGGRWHMLARGPLPEAGAWTHQYADPGNTACSDDERVRGDLSVLWYGEPGPSEMVERHARAAAPLAMDGRLFVQGEEKLMAYDAYNGMLIWKREVPGAVRVRVDSDMSNLALARSGLFVAAGNQCLRLDPATGETIHTYPLPDSADGKPRRWGYLAVSGGLLFGTCSAPLPEDYGAAWYNLIDDDGEWINLAVEAQAQNLPAEQRAYLEQLKAQYEKPDERAFWDAQHAGVLWRKMTQWPDWGSVESPIGAVTERILSGDSIFALDTETGKLNWRYDGGPIAHPAIAISDNMVFLADCRVSDEEKEAAMAERNKLIERGTWEKEDIDYTPENADVRRVLALDAATGQKRWERVMDLTGCGGDRMGLACKDSALCFFGCFSNHDRDLFLSGKLAWRRITVVDANSGADKWSKPLNYLRRPVIVNNEILIEPRACNLQTGAVKTRLHPLTGEESTWEYVRPGHCCSATSACPNMFFLRGYFLWYYDLERDQGMLPFGGIRPGCWINTIPANGLVLFPEASAGCTCSYPVRATVAMAPKKDVSTWAVCVQHGEETPVRRLAINFGAPGDWRDNDGGMWFAYPHPPSTRWHSYGITFHLNEEFYGKESYFSRNFQGDAIENTDKPWLFASGCEGLKRLSVPLIAPGQPPASYTVRLYFAEPRTGPTGKRVFSIALQGQEVQGNAGVYEETGGHRKASMKEFKGITVEQDLAIELSSNKSNPGREEAPILNALEIIRENAPVANAASR